jgi:hypothetical protein
LCRAAASPCLALALALFVAAASCARRAFNAGRVERGAGSRALAFRRAADDAAARAVGRRCLGAGHRAALFLLLLMCTVLPLLFIFVFWGMAFVSVLAHAHCTPHQASAFNYIEV